VHLPILNLDASVVPERLLVVGDPARVARAASLLEQPVELGVNREYVAWAGWHHGTRVGVVSHGVGASGAGTCFDELFRAGARRVIRAGTCGGMQPHVVDGDLVIATAAVRDDGFTAALVPAPFPAVATVDVVTALRVAASGTSSHEGIVLTSATFYPSSVLGSALELWQRAGVVAVEMECAALLVLAQLYGREAGAILAVDGNPLLERDTDMSGYDPHREVVHTAVERMLTIGLDALVAD
jgi:uridine phosphorylase